MKRIAVITGSRAEYGLLYWIIKEIEESSKLELKLIVTGNHFMEQYGYTYKEIIKDGFNIDKKIDLELSGNTGYDISKAMGVCCSKMAEAFQEISPDMILVLGDRYELLSVISVAIAFRIPIAHIAGGEVTEGAIDEQIRHAITKAAHIHFPGCDIYSDNIKKMGEESWRIFDVGDSAIEVIKRTPFINRLQLFEELDIDTSKETFLITLHPTTLNDRSREIEDSKVFFDTVKEYSKDYNLVITYPNADMNSDIIIKAINCLTSYQNIRVVKNLGSLRYLSLMKEAVLVLGNSSSALVEAPFLKKAVINYGERQAGRLKADNIIDVEAGNGVLLKNAIDKAIYDERFMEIVKHTKSLYGEGDTSQNIVKVLENIEINEKLLRKKLSFNL